MGRTLNLGVAFLASIVSLAVAAPPRSGDPQVSISVLTGCHAHGASLYCMAGTTEYHIATTLTATRTQDLPAQFTNCHSHGAELECYGPNGDEVEAHVVADEATSSGAANGTITATATTTAAAATAAAATTTSTVSADAGATQATSPAVTSAATLAPTTTATPATDATDATATTPAVSTVAGGNFSGASTLDARFCAGLGFVVATAAALLFVVSSV